jgi:hypothetical protein
MTTYNYIVLADSNGELCGLSLRFKATQVRNTRTRTDDVKTTLSGSLDKSAGPILKSWRYLLRVPFQTDDSDYGTMDNLITLFELNDPNGTPSDIITLTDHYGNDFNVIFVGTLDPENATTILDGYNSHYIVGIELREVVPNA